MIIIYTLISMWTVHLLNALYLEYKVKKVSAGWSLHALLLPCTHAGAHPIHIQGDACSGSPHAKHKPCPNDMQVKNGEWFARDGKSKRKSSQYFEVRCYLFSFSAKPVIWAMAT